MFCSRHIHEVDDRYPYDDLVVPAELSLISDRDIFATQI
ncbi:hypothetical protein NX02_01870 [Sphingomonas sanxanigenens DSM 19645 = NX02]|uniref:Uncharacterized protein n=1 Tax=Sphingomonas sanxanigenens DSM 19645 = NX02 TaxID=1123269 RepID=W0A521_9SPHN|nr:hypothetical protein NX02_01870 [Sphingomonas sanxanigenens DSM 19645 = NX02]